MEEGVFEYLNRHVSVSRETFERLMSYHNLLQKWQPRINLISNDTLANAWQRHFLDSLQLKKHIRQKNAAIIDMGSGAGFPGMVLAIAGISPIHLVESDAKKISFLKEVARITHTSVFIHHGRIETVSLPKPHLIMARALAPLEKLLHLSASRISHETICLFPKGKNYSTELKDAKKNWLFEETVFPSVTDPQGVVLMVSNIRRRDDDRKEKPRRKNA